MKISEVFSKRIFLSLDRKNTTIKRILCSSKNRDIATILLSIYLIENYFRPSLFRKIEFLFYNNGFLKDPTIGPFQIRVSLLRKGLAEISNENLLDQSVPLVKKWIKQFGLDKDFSRNSFTNFGLFYNGSKTYGVVMSNLFRYINISNGSKMNRATIS